MKGIRFLYAAYVATWLIHAFYLGSLVRRYSRLRERLREIGKK
jgi:CcmD family protein